MTTLTDLYLGQLEVNYIPFSKFVDNLKKHYPLAKIHLLTGQVLTPDEFLKTVDPNEMTYMLKGYVGL